MPTLVIARARLLALAGLTLGLLAGCGGPKSVTVTGKVVLPAKLKVAETDSINLQFVPEDGGKGVSASVDAKDLSFTTQAPPGKYKIGLTVTPYSGMKDSEKRTEQLDQLLGPFNPGATPLRYEVTSDSTQTITVDAAKGSVSK